MNPPALAAMATEPQSAFAQLGLCDELLSTTAELGYTEPSPIQREAIPPLLQGRDLLGQAATGTGKTAAFALPVLEQLSGEAAGPPQALVVVPTRELAMQVTNAMLKYGQKLGTRIVSLYGGDSMGRQLAALHRGVHVVVATPGRACDHIRRGSLNLSAIRTVVLDEADEMLDMGFSEDIEAILDATPEQRQTVLFSATVPARIRSIAGRYQRDPVHIRIRSQHAEGEQHLVKQRVYLVPRGHMALALGRVLDVEEPGSALVFCRTRTDVEEFASQLGSRGYNAEALHGGMDQRGRDRVMARLREGRANLLIATDVAARGLDIETLTHVVNFGVPTAPESYVHRIGRVGRAGRTGVAITLADPRHRRLLRAIEQHTRQPFTVGKVPSVGDLRRKQRKVTTRALRAALDESDLEDFSQVLESLSEFDTRALALAAIRLFHKERGAMTEEVEIPDVAEVSRRQQQGPRARRDGGAPGAKNRPTRERSHERPAQKPAGRIKPGTCMLFFGIGREAGIGPGDLVGAIAGETDLTGKQIGPIRVAGRYAVVGVPEAAVQAVIKARSASKIRGRRVRVRRYEE